MSQHDFNIDNQSAPAFRGDLNNALEALGTLSSGPTAPATTYANMLWYDTANNTLKMRSEADDAWINIGTLDQSTNTFEVSGVLDEDDMASNSNTFPPSQQSVKAYVDAEVSAIPGGVGYSQSWQDVKASRSTNTSYQNTTGKPIEVKIQVGSSSNDYFQVSDDGVTWITLARSSKASLIEMGGIIPDDHYYRLNGTVTINYWVELR